MTAQVEPGPLELLEHDGEMQLRIPNVDHMPPFLMSVLSSTDLWMFIASNGGLTAGRISADHSLFPYETSDRLYERPQLGGPITMIRMGDRLWSPFDPRATGDGITRNLTKSALGDRIAFEEINEALGLGFSYEWAPSEQFGWVRTSSLWVTGSAGVQVHVLDGLLDVLPAGVPLSTQQRASNLIDAYRHTEFHTAPCALAIYSMSSLLTDRAEPAAALRGNVVWRAGLPGTTHLSADAVARWRRGQPLTEQTHLRGRKGAYLVDASVSVDPGHAVQWRTVGDVSLDGVQMAALRSELSRDDIAGRIEASLEETRRGMTQLVAAVDGGQRSADRVVDANHLSNAIFNALRGGVLVDEGHVARDELRAFLRLRNRTVANDHAEWIEGQTEHVGIDELRRSAEETGDPNLMRLIDEILPLAFGRRHGDPSRPWNQFEIRTKTDDGRRAIHYEGNWRDIFQNWEALALSYPNYLPSMIAKFVNATTVDGFNPYRVSREGIDWEVPDPEDPWSNIGYWGDHQIIYLLRLLEALQEYQPELLAKMLDERRFSFADVPYRICPYSEMLEHPRDTIEFDETREARVEGRVEAIGQDGRLVWRDDEVVLTNLWEKLLIPLLSKLSSFVVDGGIWMNTQRPEWNDANNALPGYGLSVVTMAHTLRYVGFLRQLAAKRSESITTSTLVSRWFEGVRNVLEGLAAKTDTVTQRERREALDQLGNLFSDYREAAYRGWPNAETSVAAANLERLLVSAETVLERSFRANLRNDGLFHSYNTMSFEGDEVHVHRLPMMLEGQVAALDARVLKAEEASALVRALYDSPLYRPDQNTFLLYPDKTLLDFEDRNHVDAIAARDIPIVQQWLQDSETRVLAVDHEGAFHFHADLKNAAVLEERMRKLEREPGGRPIPDADRTKLLDLYECTFHHAEFTGRSASMYGFEGLGCVYWHMVGKLLVAVQDAHRRAHAAGENAEALAIAYDRVRNGFCFAKSPAAYGAFPTDAYSHTPGHSGAQQPGMTGQVKEQVLTRFGELGVRLDDGRLCFDPVLLRDDELLTEPAEWRFTTSDGNARVETIPTGGLGFTLAGVPVVYRTGEASEPRISVALRGGGTPLEFSGSQLDPDATNKLFRRGVVDRIDVWLSRRRKPST